MAVKVNFSISISPSVKTSLPIFICDNNFFCFIVFCFFFGQKIILDYVYGLIFANFSNNTAIIRTFNVYNNNTAKAYGHH